MSWITQRLSGQRVNLGSLRNANRFARAEPEINLIAFIDVLLVVLIFLMVSTTFTRYNELAITLPTASGSDASTKPQSITITVSRDGRYALNGKVIDRSQLASSLEQNRQSIRTKSLENNPQVNIDADAKAPHQAVMRALEAARDANLPNVSFLVVKAANNAALLTVRKAPNSRSIGARFLGAARHHQLAACGRYPNSLWLYKWQAKIPYTI